MALLLISCAASAQNTPDAGALMRQTEQNIRYQQVQQNAQSRLSLPPAAVLDDTTLITVEHFKFAGQQLLTEQQLQAVAVPYAHRPLVKADLQKLLDAVSAAYQHAGGQALVYIPRQSLSGPELMIQVIESRGQMPPLR
jgi:hemolysin activation/secretion protein